jgi:hypothetical protein
LGGAAGCGFAPDSWRFLLIHKGLWDKTIQSMPSKHLAVQIFHSAALALQTEHGYIAGL